MGGLYHLVCEALPSTTGFLSDRTDTFQGAACQGPEGASLTQSPPHHPHSAERRVRSWSAPQIVLGERLLPSPARVQRRHLGILSLDFFPPLPRCAQQTYPRMRFLKTAAVSRTWPTLAEYFTCARFCLHHLTATSRTLLL